jgi:N-methylhydantoinase A
MGEKHGIGDRPESWYIGADVGGTFTDVVLVGADQVIAAKVPSTPHDFSQGVIAGIAKVSLELPPSDRIVGIHHATTVATNALIQQTGPPTGLITTKGFRDVLEMRRMRFPETYNQSWTKPSPLVGRHLRLEVAERVSAEGEILTKLDANEVVLAATTLVDQGIESLAVAFINSYVNPTHEEEAGRLIRRKFADLHISLSSDVLPEIREYERTSTAVANAYLMPVVSDYFDALAHLIREQQPDCYIYVMQSNGGMIGLGSAKKYPIHVLESGASAGVVGAVRLARQLSAVDVVSFDMGGTTAKACMIKNYEPLRTDELEVGASIGLGARLLRGGGYTVRVPSIDVAEVGAGGGSLVRLGSGGVLSVGPDSAGADPGPACYGRGGTHATVTDANVLLGYVNPDGLVGGEFPILAERSWQAVGAIAMQLDVDAVTVAAGVHEVANAQMVRALRSVTLERGHDTRSITLVAYGGCGPIHAAGVAESLDITRIVVPPLAGSFSAVGLVSADVEFHVVQTMHVLLGTVRVHDVQTALVTLEQRALSEVEAMGLSRESADILRWADLHYRGQWHEERVEVVNDAHDIVDLASIEQRFHEAYEQRYGLRGSHEPVMLVNLRIAVRLPGLRSRVPQPELVSVQTNRDVYVFDALRQHGRMERVAVVGRAQLRDGMLRGPGIIEETDSSVVIPHGWTASLDDSSNVILQRDAKIRRSDDTRN